MITISAHEKYTVKLYDKIPPFLVFHLPRSWSLGGSGFCPVFSVRTTEVMGGFHDLCFWVRCIRTLRKKVRFLPRTTPVSILFRRGDGNTVGRVPQFLGTCRKGDMSLVGPLSPNISSSDVRKAPHYLPHNARPGIASQQQQKYGYAGSVMR